MGMEKVPTFATHLRREGRLAQLVQSVCLTSRGSAVRIRQRPLLNPIFSPQQARALSSAGSERLPYKQRVGGSNPSAPTEIKKEISIVEVSFCFFFSLLGVCGGIVKFRVHFPA